MVIYEKFCPQFDSSAASAVPQVVSNPAVREGTHKEEEGFGSPAAKLILNS